MDETLLDYSITKPKKRCDTPKHRKVQDSLEETPHWKSNHVIYRSSKALFRQCAKAHSLFSLTSVRNIFGFWIRMPPRKTQPTPSEKKKHKRFRWSKKVIFRHFDRRTYLLQRGVMQFSTSTHRKTTIVHLEPPRIYRVFYVGDPSSIVLKNQDFKDQGSTKTQGHEREPKVTSYSSKDFTIIARRSVISPYLPHMRFTSRNWAPVSWEGMNIK